MQIISEKEIIITTLDNVSDMNIKIGLNSKLKLRISARNDFQFSISPVNSRKTYTFFRIRFLIYVKNVYFF